MAEEQTFFWYEGKQIALLPVESAKFVRAARDQLLVHVASRLAKSTRIGIDRQFSSRYGLVVRGEPEKLELLRTYPDIRHTRGVFRDENGLELILTDHVLVRFQSNSSVQSREALCRKYESNVRQQDGDLWILEVQEKGDAAPLDIANQLSKEEIVDYAEPDALQKARYYQLPRDPRFGNQWHLQNTGQSGGSTGADVNAVAAWGITEGEPAVRIVVHDTGVDIDHPDLMLNMLPGRDFDNDDNNASNDTGPHGTACAGIVAAPANGAGVVGIAPRCRIVPLRAAEAHPWSIWANTFDWAAQRGEIISCSWGITPSNTLSRAIRRAAQNGRNGKGIPIFFATGNNGTGGLSYPASLTETIAVGASTNLDQRSLYSQFGQGLDFLAPSSGGTLRIETTDIEGANGYNTTAGTAGDYCNANDNTGFGGTSAATPLAAGTGALLLSANATLTAEQVRQILRDTADKIDAANANYDANGWSTQYGFGRINAGNALREADELRPPVRQGDFTVVWEDDKDNNGYYQIYARGFAADGRERFHDITVNSVASGQQLKPAVAVAPSGNFVVVWEDDQDQNGYYQIYARGFRSDSLERFHDVTVNSVASGQQVRPDVAITPNGEFVVVWEDDKDNNGYYQIYARGFTADGRERFHDIVVNSVASGQQLRPDVAMASNGEFVVVWQDDKDDNGYYQIYARGFTADGHERFHDIVVNSIASGQQLRPDVAMASNGEFVVVWQDDKDDNGYYQIYARGFTADGRERFHDIVVNSVASGQQLKPAVAIAPSGNFVVVWEDDQDRNGYYQIYARGFTADGRERFHDIVVNSVASGQQLRPDVAMASNGEFVVVWQDDKDDNGYYQIYARGFTADGRERFHDITVNSVASGQQLKPSVAIVESTITTPVGGRIIGPAIKHSRAPVTGVRLGVRSASGPET